MKMSVVNAQNESIRNLRRMVSDFTKRKGSGKTRVIPLSIPTGWGKTRIAIQSVINQSYSSPPTVILWPQNQAHLSDKVWKDVISWCPKAKAKCEVCESDKVRKQRKFGEIKRPKPGSIKRENAVKYQSHHGMQFSGQLLSRNNRVNGISKLQAKQIKGPIIFIIDEWHTKGLLEEFGRKPKNAEEFWRNKLLGKGILKQRKLLILLISATPIGATREMDNFSSDDENVEDFELQLQQSLTNFVNLIQVGNRNQEYNILSTYTKLIKKESDNLAKEQRQNLKPREIPKQQWIQEYVATMRKVHNNTPKLDDPVAIYRAESFAFAGVTNQMVKEYELRNSFKKGFQRQTETSKLKTLLMILRKHPKRKFVVFCRHKAVMKSVIQFLTKNNVKALNFSQFDEFEKDPKNQKVLVVMDEHSQGVSMHQSGAWLIHFELTWNPICIIQRFGRVWRIDHAKKDLTKPVAFYIPHTFSSEEEMIRRLESRWEVLMGFSGKKEARYVNLAPIPFKVALGIRCSPHFMH